MKYRILLDDRLDEFGVMRMDLLLEIDKKIYRSSSFYDDREHTTKKEAVESCFKQIIKYLEIENYYDKTNRQNG